MPSNSLCASSFCFQIRYCGDVLSWMAECFAQSTLKCGKEVPKAPSESKNQRLHLCTTCICNLKLICGGISVSLTGSKSASTKDAARGQTEREGNQEEAANRAGHSGHGDYKKATCDDE